MIDKEHEEFVKDFRKGLLWTGVVALVFGAMIAEHYLQLDLVRKSYEWVTSLSVFNRQ